jgi:hypothetical protein
VVGFLILGLVKILDNVILTFKSIYTFREEKIISSILVVISQLIFYLVIDQVISDNTLLAIVIVSVSSGIGNYIAFILNNKFKKAAKWTFVITSSNKEELKTFCDYLVEHKIKYIVCNGYNRKWDETVNVMVFSKSKEESRLIEAFLATTESKYLKEII